MPLKSGDLELCAALIGSLFTDISVQLIGPNFKCPKYGTDSLVNKANLVHKFILSVFIISTCFGRLCAHHQKKQLLMSV